MNTERHTCIIRTSAIGIGANFLLGFFKIIFGLLSGSVAIITDAIGNFTDALASIVIIVGTVFANKSPDPTHPYGYGRFEHIVTSIISLIVLYAGIEAIRETIEALLHPEAPHYSASALFILILSIIIKLIYGTYTKKRAEHVDSPALEASGSEAVHHALISILTLLSAIVTTFTGIHLEALASGVIGVFIIIEGIHLLKDALSELLGQSVSQEKAQAICKVINSFPEVHGAYDLHLHDYGVDRLEGSVHIAVNDTMSIHEFDTLSRRIFKEVRKRENVLLYGIGLYSVNTDTKAMECHTRDDIIDYISSLDHVRNVHGYYFDPQTNEITFDVGVDFSVKSLKDYYHQISTHLKKLYPGIQFNIVVEYSLT